jgi:uncharacterized membrane protein (DUF441 family)
MKNIVLRNGIISGVIVAGLMVTGVTLMKDNPDFDSAEILGYLGMLLSFTFIFVAVFQQRKAQQGSITFGKGFTVGVLVSLIAGLIYATTWEIYFTNWGSNFMEVYSQDSLQRLADSGASESDIEMAKQQSMVMIENYKNPFFRFAMTLVEIVPLGIVISLIAALILKKK